MNGTLQMELDVAQLSPESSWLYHLMLSLLVIAHDLPPDTRLSLGPWIDAHILRTSYYEDTHGRCIAYIVVFVKAGVF